MNRTPFALLLPAILLAKPYLPAVPQSGPESPDSATEIRWTRENLGRGNFAAALRRIAGMPADRVYGNPEILTLRGLASWGQALRTYSELAHAATEVEMIRRALGAVGNTQERQHQAGDPESFDNAMAAMSADLKRCRSIARDLPTRFKEVDRLFSEASADFDAAAKLTPRSKAAWCETPECWQLLSRSHYELVIWQQQQWASSRTGLDPADVLAAALPQYEPKELEALKTRTAEILQNLVRTGDSLPRPADIAQCVADAMVLQTIGDGRLKDWTHRWFRHWNAPTNRPPLPAPGGKDETSPLKRIADVERMMGIDPIRASADLYTFAADRKSGSSSMAARYSAYSLTFPTSPEEGLRLLDALTSGELRTAVHLERARFAIRDGKLEDGVAELGQACRGGRLFRPVLSAAPPSIRMAFLRAAGSILGPGTQDVTAPYQSLFHSFRPLAAKADTAAQRVETAMSRLRLAQLLITSELPWDRELGYSQASEALSQLGHEAAALDESQKSYLAGLEKRLRKGEQEERFPPYLFMVADGNAVWMRNTHHEGVVRNPAVLVMRGGLTVTSVPQRKNPD